jgi:hypothetical protein
MSKNVSFRMPSAPVDMYEPIQKSLLGLADIVNKDVARQDAEQDRLAELADKRYNRAIQDERMGWLRDEQKAKEKAKADKAAYLKGASNPTAFGLKPGREDVVRDLGNLTGDDMYKDAPADIKALMRRDVAGEGVTSDLTAEDRSKLKSYYNTTADRLAEMMKEHIGYGIDDIATGLAASMPDNAYAAEQAIKANVSRRKALTDEIARKSEEATKLEGERLKYLGKAAGKTGTSGSMAKGTKQFTLGNTNEAYKILGIDPKKNKYAATQVSEMLGEVVGSLGKKGIPLTETAVAAGLAKIKPTKETGFGPWKTPAGIEKMKEAKDAMVAQAAREYNTANKSTTNTEYADFLGGRAKANRDALEGLRAQLEGRAGVDDLAKVLSMGFGDKGAAAKKKKKQETTSEIDKVLGGTVNNVLGLETDEDRLEKLLKSGKETTIVTNNYDDLTTWSTADLKEVLADLDPKEDSDVYQDYVDEINKREKIPETDPDFNKQNQVTLPKPEITVNDLKNLSLADYFRELLNVKERKSPELTDRQKYLHNPDAGRQNPGIEDVSLGLAGLKAVKPLFNTVGKVGSKVLKKPDELVPDINLLNRYFNNTPLSKVQGVTRPTNVVNRTDLINRATELRNKPTLDRLEQLELIDIMRALKGN